MIQPNFHVALIHVPLGLLAVGILLELLSLVFHGSNSRTAARWMIALGTLGMIPTALTGAYALSDVARRSMPVGDRVDVAWVDVLARTDLYAGKTSASDAEGAQWRLISGHVWRMIPATVLAVLAVLVWMGLSDAARRYAYLPCGLALIAATTVMFWGSWMAGEAVYRYGTAVGLDQRRNAPAMLYPSTQPGAANEMTQATTPGTLPHVLPPLQTHITLSGIAIAAALSAIAMAFRNSAVQYATLTREQEESVLTGVADPGVRPAVPHDMAMLRSFKPAAAMSVAQHRAPAAGLWLATSLLALVSAGFGLWFLSGQTDAARRAAQDDRSIALVLWETIKTPAAPPGPTAVGTNSGSESPLNLNRRSAHAVAGAAIIVVPLLMAALARWAPKRRWLLAPLALVVVLAIGVQVWLGVLMTLDTPGGSLFKLNAADFTAR